jgi:hypothetical protein
MPAIVLDNPPFTTPDLVIEDFDRWSNPQEYPLSVCSGWCRQDFQPEPAR